MGSYCVQASASDSTYFDWLKPPLVTWTLHSGDTRTNIHYGHAPTYIIRACIAFYDKMIVITMQHHARKECDKVTGMSTVLWAMAVYILSV